MRYLLSYLNPCKFVTSNLRLHPPTKWFFSLAIAFNMFRQSCNVYAWLGLSNIVNANIIGVQLNMFLSRLCGEPIGFTVIGIFVIDKNTVLTVSFYSWTVRILACLSLQIHDKNCASLSELISHTINNYNLHTLLRTEVRENNIVPEILTRNSWWVSIICLYFLAGLERWSEKTQVL